MPFQYQGPSSSEVTRTIAGALQQKQQTDRQRDIDALTYGIGAEAVDPNDPSSHQGNGFTDRIRQGLAKVTGRPDPVAARELPFVRNSLNNMATTQATQNNASINNTLYGTNGNGGAPNVAPSSDNPGAFSALTGGFTPAGVPAKLRLPSGKIVDTMMTPFGRQMMQAQETRNFQQMMLQEKGDQSLQQIGARGAIQSGIADKRIAATNQNVDKRIEAQRTLHDTPSGSTIYSVQNRITSPNNADPASAYVTKRMAKLVAPTRDPNTGLEKPGLSPKDAAAQAQSEWDAAHGSSEPKTPPPRTRGIGTKSTGNIDLRTGNPPPEAIAEHQQQAAKYQQALKMGIDPQKALEAYAQDVAATKKKYGIKD